MMRSWLQNHKEAAVGSFTRLSRTPFATLMTLTVIAIALALPMIFLVLLKDISHVVKDSWGQGTQISVYLQNNISEERAKFVLEKIRENQNVGVANDIPPEKGREFFIEHSGLGDVFENLDSNPLPWVIEVQAALSQQSPANLEALRIQLSRLPYIESVRLDMEWVNRLHHLLSLGRDGVYGLAALLCLGVLLIIGNTIRLIVLNNRTELVVMKLVGATDAFARRSFLYAGFWYGLLGAIYAWLLTDGFVVWLSPTVQRFSNLYSGNFQLHGPDSVMTLSLLGLGSVLGLTGAWLAVNQHLRSMEVEN